MSLTAIKKKEIINNLGKYRNSSDVTIKAFLDFSREITTGLNELTNNLNNENKINPQDLAELLIKLEPIFNSALDGAEGYYESLSKYYVTALQEIASIKTDKIND